MPVAEFSDDARLRLVSVEVVDERTQKLELCPRAQHGFVGIGEIREVVDERLDTVSGVERFEHVGADEVVEVVNRLHGHGLVEQVHRLFGLDAEVASEVLAVVRERVVDARPELAELASQPGEVGTEVTEVFGDRQFRVGHDEESVGLALVLFPGPEHLRERDGGAEPGVGEHAENDGVMPRVAQSHRS